LQHRVRPRCGPFASHVNPFAHLSMRHGHPLGHFASGDRDAGVVGPAHSAHPIAPPAIPYRSDA
jgi:hypothetical protein